MSAHTTHRSERNSNPAPHTEFIEIGTCACGKPATKSCRTGISPGKWTEPKQCCQECWKLELPKVPEPTPDFTIDDHGSILVLTGKTEECREWIKENVGDDNTQTWGRYGIVVEPRYIQDICFGLQEAGFTGAVS